MTDGLTAPRSRSPLAYASHATAAAESATKLVHHTGGRYWVSRIGVTGEKRTFHSFRHTHAKVALEHGRSITWLQRRLGHQSITITIGRYGHWERAARRREAEQLVGAFGV